MYNYHSNLLRIILVFILESAGIICAFSIAYYLRSITDGIPFLQLPIPYISTEQFFPFIIFGVLIWWIVFSSARLYSVTHDSPLFEEIRKTLVTSFLWFFVYIGFVYMTMGFLFSKEIPRLIIWYTYILSTVFSIIIRICISVIWEFLYRHQYIPRNAILVLHQSPKENLILPISHTSYTYKFCMLKDTKRIEQYIRSKDISAILLADSEYNERTTKHVLDLAKIYGIPCVYPRILPHLQHFSKTETFLGGMPIIQLSTIAMNPWERIFKRLMDIILSIVFLVILFPILIIIYIAIKIEDPSGPAIYKNRRVGQNGKHFTLYKFRYMYWKYCVKEDYIDAGESDEGLQFEEELKKHQNTREGPLYKIKNDPRKMKFGSFIEKLSLDELPQLFNVLIGNMSLVGPRPHQPREVVLYQEYERQVLTIKPGITGMAQVFGRDKNTFQEENSFDIFYIENYSLVLDLAIILRTIIVIGKRSVKKEKENLQKK